MVSGNVPLIAARRTADNHENIVDKHALKVAKFNLETTPGLTVFGHFKFVEETFPLTFRGLEIKAKYGLQYFDSLLVATAEKGLCETFYSEDLNDGEIYAGVKAVNPFR